MNNFYFNPPNQEFDELLNSKLFSLVEDTGKMKVYSIDKSQIDVKPSYLTTFLTAYKKIVGNVPAFFEMIAQVGMDIQKRLNEDYLGIPDFPSFNVWNDAIIRFVNETGKVAYIPVRIPKNDKLVYETFYDTVEATPLLAGIVEMTCSSVNFLNVGFKNGEQKLQFGFFTVESEKLYNMYYTCKDIGYHLDAKNFHKIID